MKFSQRIGITPVRESIQVRSIDAPLTNRLWNNIYDNFINKLDSGSSHSRQSLRANVCTYLWTEFFGERVDEIPTTNMGNVSTSRVVDHMKSWFFNADWYEKYDLIEFLAMLDATSLNIGFIDFCNKALKKELAGYRIIEAKIVQITSE